MDWMWRSIVGERKQPEDMEEATEIIEEEIREVNS
jgi:hypothetical protein